MIRSAVLLAPVLAGSSGCSDDRICESVFGRRFDLDRKCYESPVELSGLRSCRMRTDKGTSPECVASPSGEVFVVTHNMAASLEGSAFRYGDALNDEETALCTRASREIGHPAASSECAATDAGL
jgi:hypothetical protein